MAWRSTRTRRNILISTQVVPGLDSDSESDDDPDEAPFDDKNWVDPLPKGTRKKRALDKIAPYCADLWEHLNAAIEKKKTQKPRKKKKPDLVPGQTFLNFAPRPPPPPGPPPPEDSPPPPPPPSAEVIDVDADLTQD